MSDLISRQAVLNELPHANWGKEWDEALAKAIIESVPTIDPVKHGKWIIERGACEPDYMECSCCRWITEYYSGLEEDWNYCPNCGASMERSDYYGELDNRRSTVAGNA